MNDVETFIQSTVKDTTEAQRAAIREMAAKAIQGAAIRLTVCPAHLRDDLKRAIIQEAYKRRSKGQRFDPKGQYMPQPGQVTRVESRAKK